MEAFDILADAFDYPASGWLERLVSACAALPQGSVRNGVTAFLTRIEPLSTSEREEIFTRTFDLNPLVPAYVGYVIYGDNYQRGEFMAKLKRAQDAVGVDAKGELPDHLRSVLRYLARADTPLPALLAILHPAVKKISKSLVTFDAQSPYRGLLETTERAVARLGVPLDGGVG